MYNEKRASEINPKRVLLTTDFSFYVGSYEDVFFFCASPFYGVCVFFRKAYQTSIKIVKKSLICRDFIDNILRLRGNIRKNR